MAVITISRELGSGGSYIARQVAQTLGYYFVDRGIIEKVLNQYGFVQFREEYESEPSFWERLDAVRAQMIKMMNRVIQATARHGNVVILGRGSFAVLHGFADVLNVRLQAPLPLRVKRVMAEQNITDFDKAEALVKENDKVRTAFINSWYEVDWDTADAFDLVINTSKIPPDMAVRWLVEALSALKAKPAGDQPTMNTIEVDSVLANVISEMLDGKIFR
jgi:cytidylate kinase